MALCPYCKKLMTDPPPYTALSGKKLDIYTAIAAGGELGVTQEYLMANYFIDRKPVTLRVSIHYINQHIKPARIEGRGKSYFLKL